MVRTRDRILKLLYSSRRGLTLWEICRLLNLRYSQVIREIRILLKRGHVRTVKIRGRVFYLVREDQRPVLEILKFVKQHEEEVKM